MKHLTTLTLATLALFTQAATAQDAAPAPVATDSWSYELKIYGWGTEVSGEALGAEFEIGFDQLLENLNFALMGGVVARRGDWGWYVEGNYAHISADNAISFEVLPGAPAGGIDVDVEMTVEQSVLNFGASYRLVETDSYRLYGTLGGRYLGLDTELKADGPRQKRRASGYQDSWDLTIGVNGRADINEDWFVPFAFDIGTGQSNLTWQAWAGIGYEFNRSDLVFGYRHMEWDLGGDDLITEYKLSGPAILWNYRF
ncbi:hypothetical protein R3X27_08500 [Tropicimonas sp. TH_r6]|uniref:hypothetical protein n=1 Tax=Tropicimonas sp. TH_r6 TaxID=3082085 RepID=UPI002953C323|nr:hypothetical protein [Tropicimonas sp. TH_r6]MDV7142721.1 hypothetical protein [Tropicimonas sp. TH_r6]